ncbi:hypothetical protein UFOVP452_37 [uncultured Caudovirales phage]|uniref:Uncharacterized protein n=1 Tax=uncultured Caudovirales phage TaxID=2100421 RepID=A0A6J5M7U4_9CAUD|nr:hypothetical protein UFOVP452_37 [uncultured Caudovirales phage]
MTERAIFGWPRWTDKVTLTGGSWDATFPRENMRSLPLARVARSTNLLPASTQVIGTLDKPRGVRLFALVRHNLSLGASYRLSIYSDTGGSVLAYDTGITNVWPAVYPSSSLAWEDANWWTGTYTADDLVGQQWLRPIWLGRLYVAGSFKLEIFDAANPAGYVEIGLLEVTQGWQTSVNMAYDYQEGWRFRSTSVEAIGGGRYVDRRDKPRVARGQIAYLPRDEAMARYYEMLRQLDVTEPVLWFPFPDEPIHWLRTVWLARLVDPGLMALTSHKRNTVPFALEEVL